MQLSCPKCGTRDVRVAQRRGIGEFLRGLVGICPMRCRHCKERWETSAWENSAWKYARCPKCFRQDLSTWSAQYYFPTFWTRLWLNLGATPYRCAACRCNFASFKKCKERFSWRHKERPSVAPGSLQASAEFTHAAEPGQPAHSQDLHNLATSELESRPAPAELPNREAEIPK